MRMRSMFAAALLLLTAGCSYSPDFASGTLKCSADQTCPEGYGCVEQLCYKNEHVKFAGHWIFGSPSPQKINCGGVMMNQDLAGDYLDVIADETGHGDLSGDYYCVWSLHVSGDKATLAPSAACTKADPDPTMMLKYTWHADKFTITTTDGRTGTLDASIPYDYQYTDVAGATGTCSMTITSTMSKGTASP
jgi:hypothetical protein